VSKEIPVKFICNSCKKGVQRVTVKCDIDNSLCPKCAVTIHGEPKVTVEQVEIPTELPSVETSIVKKKDTTREAIFTKLKHYRSILDRVEELANTEEGSKELFYTLYDQARKEIVG
jgi:hypothetical protein